MRILSEKKAKKINLKKECAKKYLLKYIKELKVHFNLCEKEITSALYEIWFAQTPLYRVTGKLKKYFRGKK